MKLKTGNIDVVVCMKTDRFSRDTLEFLQGSKSITESGGYLLCGDSYLPIIDAKSKFINQINLITNEMYARDYAERTALALRYKASNGKYVSGRPPIGYKAVSKDIIEIDTDKVFIVKTIFEKINEGWSTGKVSKYLNQAGFKTNNNNTFSKNSVYTIATNVIYTGKYVYNRINGKKKKTRILLQDYEEIVVENAFPAIISKELFEKVQQKLSCKHVYKDSMQNHVYLLTGLIECKACGRKMTGVSNRGGRNKQLRYYYECQNHKQRGCISKNINAEYLENYILEVVIELLKNNFVEKDFENLKTTEKIENKIEKKKLTETIALLKKQIDNLNRNLSNVSPDDVIYKSLQNDLYNKYKYKEEKEKRLTELNELTLKARSFNINTLNKRVFLENREITRQIINAIIKRIIYDEKNHTLEIIFY